MTSTSVGEIIAHRGASHDAPENTLAAIRLAWRQQADAVEIDIHLSADDQIVVIHDDTTARTAGGGDRRVAELTLAELKQLDAGLWKAPQFAGERIPTLGEVLATIPDGKRLFIEIKAGAEILPVLVRELQTRRAIRAQAAIIGFNHDCVAQAKKLLPEHKVYWVVQLGPDKRTRQVDAPADELIQKVRAAHLDGLNVGNSPALDPAFVNDVKRAGLELFVWTVNNLEKAREYRGLGVNGITTDRPGELRKSMAGALR